MLHPIDVFSKAGLLQPVCNGVNTLPVASVASVAGGEEAHVVGEQTSDVAVTSAMAWLPGALRVSFTTSFGIVGLHCSIIAMLHAEKARRSGQVQARAVNACVALMHPRSSLLLQAWHAL